MSTDQCTHNRRAEDQTLAALVTQMGALHADVGVIKTGMSSFSAGMEKLTHAITQLAIVEERQIHAAQAIERCFKLGERLQAQLDSQDTRITELEKSEPAQNRTSEWVDRAVWAIVSAAGMFTAAKLGVLG